MRGLQGKTVLVVGGTGGIGTATSLRLGAEGANVVVAARRRAPAEAVAERISGAGGTALAIELDIGDDDAVVAGVSAAVEAFGGLDGVHLNASDTSLDTIGNDTDAQSIDLDVFDRTVRTNLRGSLLGTRHAIPHLLARGGGSLVYTSSAAAFVGEPQRPAYAMTKSGIHALVRHVASKWGKEGVRANAVAPGPTFAEEMQQALDPSFKEQMLTAIRSPRLGKPEDIAAIVAFLMSSDGEWINGQVISVDGGMTLR